MAFSAAYRKIIEDPESLKAATAGSFAPTDRYDVWEDKRRFIADLITKDGTILDIGCANGFFLFSLREWSGRHLEIYGIDVLDEAIREAKLLLPDDRDHFAVLDARRIKEIAETSLPARYDFVFWNIPTAWNAAEHAHLVRAAAGMAGTRFIAGCYGTNSYAFDSPEWEHEREGLRRRIQEFEAAGIRFSGVEMNPTKFNQIVGWIDA